MLDETELKPREGELWRLEKVVQRTVPNERRERQKPWCKSHEPLQESSKGPATLGGRRITGGQANCHTGMEDCCCGNADRNKKEKKQEKNKRFFLSPAFPSPSSNPYCPVGKEKYGPKHNTPSRVLKGGFEAKKQISEIKVVIC